MRLRDYPHAQRVIQRAIHELRFPQAIALELSDAALEAIEHGRTPERDVITLLKWRMDRRRRDHQAHAKRARRALEAGKAPGETERELRSLGLSRAQARAAVWEAGRE